MMYRVYMVLAIHVAAIASAEEMAVAPIANSTEAVVVTVSDSAPAGLDVSRISASLPYREKLSSISVTVDETARVTNLKARNDSKGNTFIAWQVSTDEDSAKSVNVEIAKVLPNGALVWGPVNLCHAAIDSFLSIVPDEQGGVYVGIGVDRCRSISVGGEAIEVHRIIDGGQTAWVVQFAAAQAYFRNPVLVTDCANGVIVVFETQALEPGSPRHLMAQRLTTLGRFAWEIGDMDVLMPLAATANDEYDPVLLPSNGGVIAVFESTITNGPWVGNTNVAAQKLGPDGLPAWNGGLPVSISFTSALESSPSVVADGNGGIVTAFEAILPGASAPDIWVQRVAGDGTLCWGSGGMPGALTATLIAERDPQLARIDDKTIAISYASGDCDAACSMVNAISLKGTLPWGSPRPLSDSGVPCEVTGLWSGAPGQAGLLMASSSSIRDLQFRTVTATGVHEPIVTSVKESPLPTAMRVSAFPNPFNAKITLTVNTLGAGRVTIDIFTTLGQRVRTMTINAPAAGWHNVTWNGCGDIGASLASGTYIYRVTGDVSALSQPVAGRMAYAR